MGIDPKDWERAQDIYERAMALPAADRRRFIAEACGENLELAAHIEAMVEAEPLLGLTGGAGFNAAAELFEQSGEDPDGTPALSEGPGTRIGPYKLLEEIGQGGFGAVFMAEQEYPVRRRVALKIIKMGMDTRQVVARFEAERQALAMMDHPNVAKVLDGGATENGRPYFVMELVPGKPITEFCDECNMPLRERLKLFIQVCDAVHHAHQKGIIHRDIKPSNVLVNEVDGKPLAKVIDFGIAKATSSRLTARTMFTAFNQFIGTPQYMSPEQATGAQDIDTRSDVYSLGVLLYELLTGSPPLGPEDLKAGMVEELRRVIAETVPQAPSVRLSRSGAALAGVATRRGCEPGRISGVVRGELDWIVLKCLEKDRGRRYEGPRELGNDIGRHLSGEAVLAAPATVWYRARVFAWRNRVAVGALTGVMLTLMVGLGVALVVAQRLNALNVELHSERAKTEARAKMIEEKNAVIESNTYVANIQMAQVALDSRRFDLVRQRLDASKGYKKRGWEWGWLHASADNSLFELTGHTRDLTCAAFSPDGTRIVTASDDDTARVWDATSGTCIAVLKGHTFILRSAAFSPDGTRVLTASWDKTARVWDAASGACIAVLKGHMNGLAFAAFSPDGTRIVSASDDYTARVWDAASGTSIAELHGHTNSVLCAAFTPDGTRIVTASRDGTARVWNAASGASLAELTGHTGGVGSVAFSPDGTRIVTASDDTTARVWDAASGTSIAELKGHTNCVLSATFSPDGTRIVTASDDTTARVWDAASGTSIAELKGHTGRIWAAAFSPDGARILTASDDMTARVWDATSGTSIAELKGHTGSVAAAKFSTDGTRIVTASRDKTSRVWDVAPEASISELLGHTGSLCSAAFSPDGTRIVAASDDDTARMWDAASGTLLHELKGHTNTVRFAAFSPDGTRIVTASDDMTARVWDAASGASVAELKGHIRGVTAAVFSPDGTRIVTASEDYTTRVWDAASGASIATLKGYIDGVSSVAFNPDNTRIVTASTDNTAWVWDVSSGARTAILRGHTLTVRSAAFSPDGTRIATASDDMTARVWDAASGASIVELKGHTNAVTAVAFSADSTRVATASDDMTARVWDAASGASIVELKGHTDRVLSAAFSADGTRIVTTSRDNTARVWNSILYRDRYPLIQLAKATAARIARQMRSRRIAGESTESIQRTIRNDESLSYQERIAALVTVQQIIDEESELMLSQAKDLNRSLWPMVRFAPINEKLLSKLLSDATEMVRITPNDANRLNTFGVTLYRAGEYERALETLARSDAMNTETDTGPHPADRAFLAMTLFKLGRADEARAALKAFRELASQDRWKDDEETKAWLKEAQELIEPTP